MQHMCCMVDGHPCTMLSPLKPTRALHKHHGPKTNRPLDRETRPASSERDTCDAPSCGQNSFIVNISSSLVTCLHASVCSGVCVFPYGHTLSPLVGWCNYAVHVILHFIIGHFFAYHVTLALSTCSAECIQAPE